MTIPIISKADAKAQGLKRYFTGIPCKHGHIAERSVNESSRCFGCVRVRPPEYFERKKEYRRENREHISRKNKAYREVHRDELNTYIKEWREKNPDKMKLWRQENAAEVRRKTRLWKAKNPDKVKAHKKTGRQRNAEKIKAKKRKDYLANRDRVSVRNRIWRLANAEKRITISRNREARQKNAEGKHTLPEIQTLFVKQKGKCIYCLGKITTERKKENTYHADHIIALINGGSNWISNIQLLCPECNMRKNAKDPFEFARELGKLL